MTSDEAFRWRRAQEELAQRIEREPHRARQIIRDWFEKTVFELSVVTHIDNRALALSEERNMEYIRESAAGKIAQELVKHGMQQEIVSWGRNETRVTTKVMVFLVPRFIRDRAGELRYVRDGSDL